MTWHSIKTFKTGKTWQKPSFFKKKPDNMSQENWLTEIKNFRYEKNLMLGNIKISKTPRTKTENE
jgi:hypothetical protein